MRLENSLNYIEDSYFYNINTKNLVIKIIIEIRESADMYIFFLFVWLENIDITLFNCPESCEQKSKNCKQNSENACAINFMKLITIELEHIIGAKRQSEWWLSWRSLIVLSIWFRQA